MTAAAHLRQSATSAVPNARNSVPSASSVRVTVADLLELVDYTPLPTGEVRAGFERAPGVRLEVIAPSRKAAESAMHDACARLARHMNY